MLFFAVMEKQYKVWVIYDPLKRDYDVSLWKEQIMAIKQWEKILSHIYWVNGNELVRKDLVFVLSETPIAQRDYAKITREWELIKLEICKRLADDLLAFEWNMYEHRYDSHGNKMYFGMEGKNKNWLRQKRAWISSDIELYDDILDGE